MRSYRIAWMAGAACPEVCEAARLVLDAVEFQADYIQADILGEAGDGEGGLPRRTIELLRETDCAFLGEAAAGGRSPHDRSPSVRLRQLLDLYCCVRPAKALPGNPLNFREGIDLVVFRENTEGMYTGVEFDGVPESFYDEPAMARIPRDAAVALRGITGVASRRIARAAFAYAVRHGRRKVTAAHKSAVLPVTCGLFLRAAGEVAAGYPQIEFETAAIDDICTSLARDPTAYDVILTTNLFGEILSALCAQLAGGMGLAYGGHIGDGYAVFEPACGAGAHAGLNQANPLAAILAARMMIEWLGERRKAARIENAVAEVVAGGRTRTPDMGGRSSTLETARAVIQAANRAAGAIAVSL